MTESIRDLKEFKDDFKMIFEEWKRRYDDNPHDFMGFAKYATPEDFGEPAAAYFLQLWDELTQPA